MKSDTYDLELGLGDLYVDASIDLGDFGTSGCWRLRIGGGRAFR